jgi:hypothetical protein
MPKELAVWGVCLTGFEQGIHGYVFAASREWRIKTSEQLNAALEAEDGHFVVVLDEFIQWLRSNGLNLGEKPEGSLREELRTLYQNFPSGAASRVEGWVRLGTILTKALERREEPIKTPNELVRSRGNRKGQVRYAQRRT